VWVCVGMCGTWCIYVCVRACVYVIRRVCVRCAWRVCVRMFACVCVCVSVCVCVCPPSHYGEETQKIPHHYIHGLVLCDVSVMLPTPAPGKKKVRLGDPCYPPSLLLSAHGMIRDSAERGPSDGV